ncbi:uncharacterized protein UV8b_03615 [Ustilaginoidea virens]|uniref:Presequence translocated-associated motor subunit PAM17 n=1 Tax=Ustilaginoidea virens TaxID=1159556 RepID=A0A8E5HPY1_USTVR|nr:uncharacterized protein UV8b_03615 [Ustilaginoidea virens]QUC19374.1 hypothetical protein UV8b_03615 [Ustilaginoidea virens]
MSSSIKSLALRLPLTAAGQPRTAVLKGCCSSASMSTTARPSSRLGKATAPWHRNSNTNATAVLSAGSSGGLASPARLACRLLPAARPTPAVSVAATQARCFASSAASSKSTLDWDSFFKLRLRRRRLQLLFSVTTGVLGGAGGAVLLSTGLAEPVVMQIPLDPFVTLGLMTLACAGMGWLAGPSIGNQVFYLMNHRFKTQMMQKESEFFARVKKNRVDPTNSSAGNPVPDFYGEKIQSVSGYRQWLKDQRAFNKKKTRAFV